MPDIMTRSVQDNRILRVTGAEDLRTSLGSSVGAAFQMPTLGTLLGAAVEGGEQATMEARLGADRAAESEEQYRSDYSRRVFLTRELDRSVDDAERRGIQTELDGISERQSILRERLESEAISEGRLKTPAQLEEQFGGAGLTFDRSMTEGEAQVLYQNKRSEIINQAISEHGPSGVIPGVAKFGAGLLAVATDPVEVATTFIPVLNVAAKARLVARGGQVGGRALIGAIEGGVGSALTEPLVYGLSRQQQLDYKMSDALLNVGLGAAFGGGIGAAAGAISRRAGRGGDATLPPEVRREVADVAIRQFATDQRVNISRFLDGTDLRATTTISRAGGIEFQAGRPQWLPDAVQSPDVQLSVSLPDVDGVAKVYKSAREADAAALEAGGTVEAVRGGYEVRQPVSGEVVRKPTGAPLTFPNERAAQKFIKSARAIPSDAAPIRIPGGYAVLRGSDNPEAIIKAADTLRIPEGVNTRDVAVVPNAEARINQAVRGTIARGKQAQGLAQHAADVASDPYVDTAAASRFQSVNLDELPAESVADLEDVVSRMRDAGELSDDAIATLDEIKDIEAHADAYQKAVDVAATCTARL